MNNLTNLEISLNEIDQLTRLIQSKYNYDFSNYALSSFKRRIERYLNIAKITGWTALSVAVILTICFWLILYGVI